MPQTINSNILSMTAQRNLNRSQADLQTTITRLSSGLRINSAKDDAAGLAIATRMSVQVSGLSVAIRNANDGISIAQTAEGAMDEMVNSLIRANDLALQAANYNTSSDRESLNQEVSQILEEMSRVVNQTRYNGEKLLTGGFSADIQVGTTVNETLNVSVSNLSPTGLGVASNYSAVNGLNDATFAARVRDTFETALATSDTINGVNFASAIAIETNSVDKINLLNDQTASTGVSAFGFGNAAVSVNDVTDANADAGGGGGFTTANGDLVINGISIDGGTDFEMDDVVGAINAKTSLHGVTAVKDDGGTDANRLVLLNRTGDAITVAANTANMATITGFAQGATQVDAGANGLIVLNDELGTGSVAFDATATLTAITGETTGTTTALADASVNQQTISTAAGANLALLAFQAGIDQINSDRATLGAKLNRLQSTIRNLENVRENISAARGRIQDADFAMETAKLTRAQILQQAGVAMVSQANAVPQSALALLQ